MIGNGGKLLLLLAQQDTQTAAELAAGSQLSPAETLQQLTHLRDQGFIVVSPDDTTPTVYRLAPKPISLNELDPHQRILLVDDDAGIQELVTAILEDDGYAVVAATTTVDAAALLDHVTFDLVITDGFSQAAGAIFVNAADLLDAARGTPVALLTAHRVDLDAALAAGFRNVIEKPFELDVFEHHIRALLAS
jgi:CheY-like chemotaxis protein